MCLLLRVGRAGGLLRAPDVLTSSRWDREGSCSKTLSREVFFAEESFVPHGLSKAMSSCAVFSRVPLSCPWENVAEECSEALSEKTHSEQGFCLWS
jgi:hypothetical protein